MTLKLEYLVSITYLEDVGKVELVEVQLALTYPHVGVLLLADTNSDVLHDSISYTATCQFSLVGETMSFVLPYRS